MFKFFIKQHKYYLLFYHFLSVIFSFIPSLFSLAFIAGINNEREKVQERTGKSSFDSYPTLLFHSIYQTTTGTQSQFMIKSN